ncbi:MAG: NYN domain-containing protein [Deltaproteobacteria bacterium]|nr:NYN domain-containing protein [Deltaproteobacteria bacterium]
MIVDANKGFFPPVQNENGVGIFVDIENVTDLDEQELEQILREVAQYGPVVVRRAYACWSRQELSRFQRPLTRLGFEMIHAWHPVSGKDSADFLMVVDVMYMAMRIPHLRTFVLVTSDSDFSPLFRRLRAMGFTVIGAGRHMPLADMVQHTCTRYLYIGSEKETHGNASRRDRAIETILQILRQHSGLFDLDGLKSQLCDLDPGFDERDLGFGDFRSFIRAIPEVLVEKDRNVWIAKLSEEEDDSAAGENYVTSNSPYYGAEANVSVYQGLLRKKGWRWADPDVLRDVIQFLQTEKSASSKDLRVRIVDNLSDDHSAAELRKAFNIVYKSYLLKVIETKSDGTGIWKWEKSLDYNTALDFIDRAILARLAKALEEYKVEWSPQVVGELLYGNPNIERIKQLRSAGAPKPEQDETEE